MATDRRLTHVELVYRPGERALAQRFFELLGCRVVDRGGEFFTSFVDPAEGDYGTNVCYASEVTPAQWALDSALLAGSAVDAARTAYLGFLREHPQRSAHFGFRVPSAEALEAVVERVRAAGRDDTELAGRVGVAGVYRPGAPGSYTDTMIQAFVWTDVVASGLLSLGQHVEVQWHVPTGEVDR